MSMLASKKFLFDAGEITHADAAEEKEIKQTRGLFLHGSCASILLLVWKCL